MRQGDADVVKAAQQTIARGVVHAERPGDACRGGLDEAALHIDHDLEVRVGGDGVEQRPTQLGVDLGGHEA